jgi:hypothetical protein
MQACGDPIGDNDLDHGFWQQNIGDPAWEKLGMDRKRTTPTATQSHLRSRNYFVNKHVYLAGVR